MSLKSPKYPPEFKAEVCEYAKKENIVSASRFYNVNQKTVSGWFKLYRDHGSDMFYLKKKRGDNKKRKIFDETLSQIVNYKSAYPETTLKELKNRFAPDCSLVLIMKKLRQVGLAGDKKNVEKQRLSVAFKVYSEKKDRINSKQIYRIEIYDNLSNTRFYGLAQDCSRNSIDLFLFSALNILRSRGKLTESAEIVTNIHFLSAKNKSVGNTMMHNRMFRIPLVFDPDLRKYNILTNDRQSRIKGLDEIYLESYVDAFKNNQIEEFLPVIDINKINKEYRNLNCAYEFEKILTSIPLQSNKIVLEALGKIDSIGDNSAIKYEYEKAIESYSKIYSISVKCKESEGIRIKTMYKTSLIYYKIENYEASRLILTEILELSEKCKSGINPGQAHYYLGKISQIKNDYSKCNFHLGMSVKLLNDSGRKYKYLYFQAVINRYLNEGKFELAMRNANKYLINALSNKAAEDICIAYGLKAQSSLFLKKYKTSIKYTQIQKNMAEAYQLPEQRINALSSLVNLYSQIDLLQEAEMHKLILQVENLSNEIKLQYKFTSINHYLGNYYFKKGIYDKAIKYFKEAHSYYKKINFVYYYVINLFSLALCCYSSGKFNSAIKYFNDVCKYTDSFNFIRICYSYNYIGRIYESTGKTDKAILLFKRSIRYANKTNNFLMVGDALNNMAFIYDNNGNKEKAIRYYLRALCTFNKIKEKFNNDIILKNIAYIKEKLHILYQTK